jgi:predicted ATPase
VQLAQAIAGRGRCLIVLDNFEQVARHAEATLGQWIDRAPQAQFIVTTREVLGIVGENVLPLTPLSNDDAVELFMRRAVAARLGFTPSAADADAIQQRAIVPSALVARMRDRFDLIGTRVGRQDRQATLRAAFDWSWELLSATEKATLAMLSVFEGGFTLDSAGAVLTGTSGSPATVVDAVLGLVDKSFVRRVGDDRFDLLETVREYAGQHLLAPGSFAGSGAHCAAQIQARHWQFFAALDENTATAGRCVEANNLVAACRAATRAADASAAAACVAVAWSALRLTGPYRVAVDLAQGVAELPRLGDRERALAHWVAGAPATAAWPGARGAGPGARHQNPPAHHAGQPSDA